MIPEVVYVFSLFVFLIIFFLKLCFFPFFNVSRLCQNIDLELKKKNYKDKNEETVFSA